MSTVNKASSRSLDTPDEHGVKGNVKIDVVQLGDIKVKRATYPAGWKFSTDMGAPRCYDTHVGYVISGHIKVVWDDGRELDLRAGDAVIVPAGHDAWVVGDEPTVIVQFDEGESAARRFNVEAVAKAA